MITEFSVVGTSLTITGSALGTPVEIEMANLACTNVDATATSITCDLSGELPSGSWWPIVTEDQG